jgi:subtilase family serine protease
MNRSLAGLIAGALVLLLTAATASAAGRPDLKVMYISEPPSALQPGDEFTTTVQVRNAGRAKARKSTARFYISQDKVLEASEAVRTRDTRAVKAGGSTLLAGRLTIPPAIETGTQYFVFVCLDSTKKVEESHERNNCTGSATLLFVRPKA